MSGKTTTALKDYVKTLTGKPGVYRMLNEKGDILYVGKARNLKKRVTNYLRANVDNKTMNLMRQVTSIEVTVTHTESEALFLENTLIKAHMPRYNILLRDDKSYPYIYLSSEQDFPRLGFHRGKRNKPGHYFGPYPSASAVRSTLIQLQKIFPVRQCEDSFYRHRTRACLQYQIKRCTAPCVGLVDKERYDHDVRHAIMFLEGKNNEVIDELVRRMEQASTTLDFERAADYRDQIARLKKIQEKQYLTDISEDLDVIACIKKAGISCIQVFMIRNGQNLGNRVFFPRHTAEEPVEKILSAFITQYYLGKKIPSVILVNGGFLDSKLIKEALSEQCEHLVKIRTQAQGDQANLLQLAVTNAEHALSLRLATKENMRQRLDQLQDVLSLENSPQRMECFDISHTMGEATVAACVVFDANGPVKSDYRRFNIKDITPGDDFAAMHQALLRRYTRIKEGEGILPDVLFIDGGKGQLAQAIQVLQELQLGGVILVGIAKGQGRIAGKERLFIHGHRAAITLPPDSGASHLIQQIRDEAHRFAITGHRQRRAKNRRVSVLEGIVGMGPKRRQRLLNQFGGLQGVSGAGVDDLATVSGISVNLARKIYDALH